MTETQKEKMHYCTKYNNIVVGTKIRQFGGSTGVGDLTWTDTIAVGGINRNLKRSKGLGASVRYTEVKFVPIWLKFIYCEVGHNSIFYY